MTFANVGLLVLLTGRLALATDYYVAPDVVGDGSGSHSYNAAAYTDAGFWDTVRQALSNQPVNVWFTAGAYTNGSLKFINGGDAANKLLLAGVSDAGAVFSDNSVLDLRGSRNVEVRQLHFCGEDYLTYAVLFQSASASYNDCRDILLNDCTFFDMPNLYYGAISVYGENAYDITIQNCTFDTIGFNEHAHALYAALNCHDITVQSNQFIDVSGHALDFRNGVSNVVVADNEFIFTSSSYGEEDACGIAVPNWNNEPSDQEIFGDYYTICRNVFDFDADGLGRAAVKFHFSGTNRCGYTQIPTSSDVITLESGSPKYKIEFLERAGLNVPHIEIYDNFYNSHVACRAEYSWSDRRGFNGQVDIYNVFYQERFSDDFNYSGDPAGWDISEAAGYTDVYNSTTLPAEGTRSARLKDWSGAHAARMDRSIGAPVSRGYYRTWVRVNSHTGVVYPFYTNDGENPSIYWIYGYSNGSWRNNDGEIFSGSWTENVWYCIEVEFDFAADSYTVWVDNTKVADRIAIPGDSGELSGTVHITPATAAEQGDMQVDAVLLGSYETGIPDGGLLVRDEFNTTGGPDYANGLYSSGADLGDAGNATCSGGTIIGYDSTTSWSDNAYIEAYANVMRIRSTAGGWDCSGRAITNAMAGQTEAYGKITMRQHLDSATAGLGYVFAGFCSSASLGSSGGASIGYTWDSANAHWDLALRYFDGSGAKVAVIADHAAYDVTQTIYWAMNQATDTIRVWVDTDNCSYTTASLVVTDWGGTVEDISHLSAGGYQSGASSSSGYVYVYDMVLGETPESVGMVR